MEKKIPKLVFGITIVTLLGACTIQISTGNPPETKTGTGVKTETTSGATLPDVSKPQGIPTSIGRVFDIRINDILDTNGIVATNKTEFTQDAKEIYVSAYISNATKDEEIKVMLRQVEQSIETPYIINKSPASGDLASNFIFTSPETTWPVGTYEAIVSLNDGTEAKSTFSVK